MCVKQPHSSDSSHLLFPDDPLSSSSVLIFLWWQWSRYLVLFDCCVNSPVYLSSCPLVHPPPHLSSLHLQTLPSSSSPPRLLRPLLFVCCWVCVLHLQIPTGPLIFNSLQQQQLSQFSPQQSQSATSSPQQQGETVRHTRSHKNHINII